MNINDITLAKIQKEKDDENVLLKKIHENHKKENIMHKVEIQRKKIEFKKARKKIQQRNKTKNLVFITLVSILIILLLFALKRMDDDFMKNCTQNLSEEACMRGL